MHKKNIYLFSIFVILSAPVFSENRGFSLGLSGGAGISLTKDSRFAVKLQPGIDYHFSTEIPLFSDDFHIGSRIGYMHWLNSSLSKGILYRGYSSVYFGLSVSFRRRIPFKLFRTGISIGGRLIGEASINEYDYTYLDYFYPSAGIEAFAEFIPEFAPFISFIAVIPFIYNFRPDLQYSSSSPFSIRLKLYPVVLWRKL
ncbi:MAG: hypothetical protein GXP33_08835 [Spirochaetes bacterium]|nr:hypothetical protein [Spirochaetota bacterium]